MCDTIIDNLREGRYKNVIIFSGAGVSTNSGIPDYRSYNSFISQSKNEYPDITGPEDIFNRKFIDTNPNFKDSVAYKSFKDKIFNSEPTLSHKFAKELQDMGILKRIYTQNIDNLYQKAGVSEDLIVEFHGNLNKDNIVLYGDKISNHCMNMVKEDLIEDVEKIDLCIVMGTTLQVAPFCGLPNMVRKSCTRIYIGNNPQSIMKNSFSSNNREPDGFYNFKQQSNFKICGRLVTLKPQWNKKSKYKKQLIFNSDCDEWCKLFLEQS